MDKPWDPDQITTNNPNAYPRTGIGILTAKEN